jgi:hypothetical protein
MKKNKIVFSAALLVAMSLLSRANADTFNFNFSGPGVSGSVELTYGAATDAKYPQAFEVTGINGVFTDVNNGLNIVNAPIGPLIAITHDTPEPGNLLAPNDFSRFAVATGLSPQNNGFLTYDNLFWPGGSPPTASDYPVHGGYLDIYGLMFSIGGGKVVDLWSNGDFSGTGNGPIDYGVAVADSQTAFDYVAGDVAVTTPDSGPGLASFGSCVLGLLAVGRSSRRK